MQKNDDNTIFINGLSALARERPVQERLLVAPSYRVGRQWLDAVALAAGGVAAIRIVTPGRLIMDFAEEGLRRNNLRPGSVEHKTRIIGETLHALARERPDSGYFTRLAPSFSFASTLMRTMEELDAAGIDRLSPLARHFSSREKADELVRLYAAYNRALGAAGLAGPGAVVRAAVEQLEQRERVPFLAIPQSLLDEAGAGEKKFFDAWPEDRRIVLPEDVGPYRAVVACRVADSAVNEVRLMLRDIQARGVELDTVEVICIDPARYIPLLCAVGTEMFGGGVENLPFTFNSGVSAAHSRPSRLLSAWLQWLEMDLPPQGLAAMVRGDLLRGWRRQTAGVDGESLAARLLELPLHGGPEDYRRVLGANKSDSAMARAESRLARLLPDILPLANGGASLDTESAPTVLSAALSLLRQERNDSGSLDAYARTALVETITAWLPHCDWPGFRPLAWLQRLNDSLHVMGLGPMPGRLHVSDIATGGHSGRPHTFILGLNDDAFPGAARQDPVLLDRERAGMSSLLPVSGRRRNRRVAAMERLLARVRGRLYCSFARHDADGDRERYPAALFTELAEKGAAELPDATLVASAPAACLCRRDDWLRELTSCRRNILTATDLGPWLPHLAQGWEARLCRESSGFTKYDGHVPEAGVDYRRDPLPVSPTDLETLAANPQEYFFKRVLGITAPDRFESRPGRWLEGNERGNLLHDLFQDFVKELIESKDDVDDESLPRHRERLTDMFEKALARYRRIKPVRDRLAYDRERREMLEACVIFLRFERERHGAGRPVCLEAALGGAKLDEPPWNHADPVPLPLPDGGAVPLKGRVDRIDRLHNHGGLMIWDYKTGRSNKFSREDPFKRGRHLQPLLYAAMLDWRVRAMGMPEPVNGFAYFFPMPRDEGKTFPYTWGELREGGMGIVRLLVDMLEKGIFPFSPKAGDSEYSDYRPVWGDIPVLGAAAREKMLCAPELAAWTQLREGEK